MTTLVETVILLLAAILALATIARRLVLPYPILLVIGGLALTFVPALPAIQLDPEVVFVVFLPPVLWAAAYFTSWRDFRANLRPILLHAVGLVLITTVGVALVARFLIQGLGWPAALALGAIVSPPDAVAATAIGRRLSIPRRVTTILEGESLINDATALVLYRAAVAAMVGQSFVLEHVAAEFVLAAAGGAAVGIVVGILTRFALRFAHDSLTEIAITLVAPYVAWVTAEQVHASGVLACVAGGFYVRQGFSAIVAPLTRTQARAVWELLVFLLNGFIFILIGLQLASLRHVVSPEALWSLLGRGATISAVAIGIRLVWVPIAAYVPRLLSPSLRRRDPMPPWSHTFVVAWTGMRGIVSLAAALALPYTTAAGGPLPFRNELIVISFTVILVTLVVQGLSLSALIGRLKFGDDDVLEHEEAYARRRAAEAALERLDGLAGEGWVRPEQVERLRLYYNQRAQGLSHLGAVGGSAEAAAALRRLRNEALTAERRTAIRLRDEGQISDDVLHRIEHELDAEAIRIGLGEIRMEQAKRPDDRR